MSRPKVLVILSLVFLSVPVILYGLWIYAINVEEEFLMAKELYKTYLPSFLQANYATAYVSLITSAISFSLALYSYSVPSFLWRALGTLILIVSGFLFLLNVWSLM